MNTRNDSEDALQPVLRMIRRRMLIQRAFRSALRGLLIGGILACVWVVATRCFPVLGDAAPVSLGVIGASLAVALAIAVAKRPSLLATALECDRRLGLDERITSSLQLAQADGPMVAAVHADARAQLDSEAARNAFGFSVPSTARWSWIPLAAFGVAYLFLPEFDLLNHQERIAEARARTETNTVRVERLVEAIKPIQDDAVHVEGTLVDTMAEIEGLADALSAGSITDKQAIARIGNLADQMRSYRQQLAEREQGMSLPGAQTELGISRELANALQDGQMRDAAEKAEALKEKLKNATTQAERDAIQKDMEELAESLAKSDSELAKALSKAMSNASQAIQQGNQDAALAAMDDMISSLQDAESIAEQLAQMDTAMQQLEEWQQDMMGPSEYCRQCGDSLHECSDGECDSAGHQHEGVCESCANGNNGGMKNAGTGRGSSVGPLPEDVEGSFTPTRADGSLTNGSMLLEIMQRGTPEVGEQPTQEYIQGAFVELQQEAEQALTKEEIPPASKEYVRQYFGSLEPDRDESGR